MKVLSYERLAGVSFAGVVLSGEAAVTPRFAIDSGGVFHAFWSALTEPFAVADRASSDAGQTWSPEETISDDSSTTAGLELAAIADPAGNVHAVWAGSNVDYRRWSPEAEWGAVAMLPSSGGQLWAAAGQDGLPWLVWSGGGQAFYARQGADGSFAAPQTLGGLGAGNAAVAVDGQGAGHLVWVEGGSLWYVVVP